MTWKSLSDVYSEQVIRNNNAATIEPPLKEWRSLSDVYTGGARRNYISEAKVEIIVNGATEEFELEDIYVQKILGLAYSASNSLDKTVNEWVVSGGWEGNSIKRITEQINSILIEVFPVEINKRDGVEKIVGDISKIKNNKNDTSAFQTLIKTESKFNLFDLFTVEGLAVLNNNIFLNKLCQISFTENQVNIGPGEVAITLFTEAKKPTGKGDLKVGGVGIVELKGTNGRIGDGRVEQNVYNTVISKAVDSGSVANKQNDLFSEIKRLQSPVSGYSKNRILEFKKVKEADNLYKILNLLYKSQNLKEIIKNKIKATEEELINRLDKLKTEDQTLEGFKNAAKEMINHAFNIYKLKDGKEALNFTTFFATPVVDEQEKINTLYKYVNHQLTPEIKGAISTARLNGMPVERIIGAIATVNYQRETGFNYIIFANTLPESIERGSMLCTVIGPFTGNSYEKDLEFVFSKVSDINFNSAHDRGGFKAAFRKTLPPPKPPKPNNSATDTGTGNSEPSLGANNSPGATPTVTQGNTSLPQAEGDILNIPV